MSLPVVDLLVSPALLLNSALLLNPAVLAALAAVGVLLWPRRVVRVWLPAGPGRGDRVGRRARGGQGAWSSAGSGGDEPAGSVVPEALELIALALLGGGSVAHASTSVAAVLPAERGAELGRVGRALEKADDADRLWDEAGEHWSPGRRCLDLAERAGVPPREALLQTARDLRRDAVADVEVAAARLGVLLVLPLGLAYLPAFVLTTIVPVVIALVQDLAI